MRTWYTYRTVTGNASFHFREDRESFEDSFTMQDSVFFWRDIAPLIFEQIMIEAELTRNYKA